MRTPIRDRHVIEKLNKEPINNECVSYFSPELQQYALEKYGPPIKPVNSHVSRCIKPQEPKEKKEPTICKIKGCEDKVRSKEMCSKHYDRSRLYGDPLFSKRGN